MEINDIVEHMVSLKDIITNTFTDTFKDIFANELWTIFIIVIFIVIIYIAVCYGNTLLSLLSSEQLSKLIFKHSRAISGGNENNLIKDYLNEGKLPVISTNIDAKLLTPARLRAIKKKSIAVDAFIDKLASNCILYLESLKTAPTDIAISYLKKYKILIEECNKVITNNNKFTSTDLKQLVSKINDAIVIPYNTTIIGDISNDELAIKYVAALAKNNTAINTVASIINTTELAECKRDLATCNMDLNSLRTTNERLREEIRRGLTNYTCESLLRDCNAAKDLLARELADLRSRAQVSSAAVNASLSNISTDIYRTRAESLANEVNDLKGVIKALNDKLLEADDDAVDVEKYIMQISKLEAQLKDCHDENTRLLDYIIKLEEQINDKI